MGKRQDHRLHWIRKLASCSVEPVISTLETGKGDGWQEVERKWIKHFRDMGTRLVNGTDGGEGVDLTPEARVKFLAAVHSPEYRAKISAAVSNPSPEVRARKAAARRGKHLSAEARAKVSAAMKGNQHCLDCHPSAETRAKLSAAKMGNKNMLGRHHTAETRAKLSTAAAARSCSLEYRAKLSTAARNHSSETRAKTLALWHSPEFRAKMSAAHKAYWAKKKAGHGPAL